MGLSKMYSVFAFLSSSNLANSRLSARNMLNLITISMTKPTRNVEMMTAIIE